MAILEVAKEEEEGKRGGRRRLRGTSSAGGRNANQPAHFPRLDRVKPAATVHHPPVHRLEARKSSSKEGTRRLKRERTQRSRRVLG